MSRKHTKPLLLRPKLRDYFRRIAMGLSDSLRFGDPYVAAIVYASELVRGELEQAIEAEVKQLGWRVERWVIEDPEEADIPLRLRAYLGRYETVFFISGLEWGKPASYNALNFRREYFYERQQRVIFWLTETEARQVALLAPDFWQVPSPKMEVLDAPAPEQVKVAELAQEEYYWPQFDPNLLVPSRDNSKLKSRQDLLKQLDRFPAKTTYARARLHYNLAGLLWANGQISSASHHIGRALYLAESILKSSSVNAPEIAIGQSLMAAVLCGRANLALMRQALNLAEQDFQVVTYELSDISGELGLGHIARLDSRLDEAQRHYQVILDRQNDRPEPELIWRAQYGLGQINYALRQLDKALEFFKAASNTRPTTSLVTLGTARVNLSLAQTQLELGQRQAAQRTRRNAEQAYRALEALEGSPYQAVAREELRRLQAGRTHG